MGSLKYQFNKKIDSLWRYKQSKHLNKKFNQYWDKITGNNLTNRADGIYSKKTMETYKDSIMKFSTYIQENFKEIKNINSIEKKHASEYLFKLAKEGYSPSTIHTRAAAIAKVMDWTTTDINRGLPGKNSLDPSKGRNGTSPHFSIEKHKDLIDFIKNTGCRKCEAQEITPSQIKVNKNGSISIDFNSKREYQVQTKGGRPREITRIDKDYQEILKNMKNKAIEKNYKTLFQDTTSSAFSHANLHQYRREYAQNLYKNLMEEYKQKEGYYPKKDYFCRGKHAGESYVRDILKIVSMELGHNREDVVINNYFR